MVTQFMPFSGAFWTLAGEPTVNLVIEGTIQMVQDGELDGRGLAFEYLEGLLGAGILHADRFDVRDALRNRPGLTSLDLAGPKPPALEPWQRRTMQRLYDEDPAAWYEWMVAFNGPR
jgi:hypothetical protein